MGSVASGSAGGGATVLAGIVLASGGVGASGRGGAGLVDAAEHEATSPKTPASTPSDPSE
jgi:hypothetical protein